ATHSLERLGDTWCPRRFVFGQPAVMIGVSGVATRQPSTHAPLQSLAELEQRHRATAVDVDALEILGESEAGGTRFIVGDEAVAVGVGLPKALGEPAVWYAGRSRCLRPSGGCECHQGRRDR